MLTQQVLRDKDATTLKDALRTTPGITIGTGEGGNAFGDRFFIRGFDARNDVFVDGIRDPGVSIRENFFTEQIEILKGPSATIDGRGTARRGTPGWTRAMVQAKGQAERYAKALPADHGWPPFLLIVDVGYCIEVYADFTGTGKAYVQFPDRASFRIMLDDLRDATIRERLRAIWEDPKSLDPTAHAAVPWTIIQTNIVGVFRLTAGLLPTRFFTPGCSRSGSSFATRPWKSSSWPRPMCRGNLPDLVRRPTRLRCR